MANMSAAETLRFHEARLLYEESSRRLAAAAAAGQASGSSVAEARGDSAGAKGAQGGRGQAPKRRRTGKGAVDELLEQAEADASRDGRGGADGGADDAGADAGSMPTADDIRAHFSCVTQSGCARGPSSPAVLPRKARVCAHQRVCALRGALRQGMC